MTPFYADDWLTILAGDCRTVLTEIPDDSVDCVVTSPPYWGLRDYGTEGQLGLERTPEEYVANMVNVFREVRRVLKPSGTCWLNLGSSFASSGGERAYGSSDGGVGRGPGARRYRAASGGSDPSQSPSPERAPSYDTDDTAPEDSPGPGSAYSDLCDGCLGDSPSRHPDSADNEGQPSVASSPDGTGRDSEPRDSEQASPDALLPDALASTTPQSSPPLPASCSHCDRCGACLSVLRSSWPDARACARKSWLNYTTFKPKDLVPIPWMVAMALQQDGWYLRRDVIWSKPNPMPESVTDRPTSSHEYLFLLTKSARYYFDADAVREPNVSPEQAEHNAKYAKVYDAHSANVELGAKQPGNVGSLGIHSRPGQGGRNIRSVWTIATRPYSGAHFAVFPPELPERCIKAGSSEKGVCPECGAPWERVVERSGMLDMSRTQARRAKELADAAGLTPDHIAAIRSVGVTDAGKARVTQDGTGKNTEEVQRLADEAKDALGGYYREFLLDRGQTTGWQPRCSCHLSAADVDGAWALERTRPAVVLDPFGGSGTVGMVANRLSRRAILIDLNPDYLKQQMRRNAQTPLGLEVPA